MAIGILVLQNLERRDRCEATLNLHSGVLAQEPGIGSMNEVRGGHAPYTLYTLPVHSQGLLDVTWRDRYAGSRDLARRTVFVAMSVCMML